MNYRYGGKEKRISLGTYPETGLAQARAKRDQAKQALTHSDDPSIIRQLAHIERNKVRAAYRRAEYLDDRRQNTHARYGLEDLLAQCEDEFVLESQWLNAPTVDDEAL